MEIDDNLVMEIAKGFPQSSGRVRYVLQESPNLEVAKMILRLDLIGGVNSDSILDLIQKVPK